MTSMRMSFCLKAATELADDDLDAITSTIEQAMKGGMDDKAAELLAVNDQLAVVELERRELVQLIQAQHGGKLKAKAKTAPGVIEDVGEKIGGARKDTAMSGFTRGAKSEKDDRPSWARRFQISQIVTPGGMLGDVKDAGRWIIRDSKSLNALRQPRQVGRQTFATKEEAEAFVPIAAVGLKHRAVPTRDGKYEIWRDVTDRKRVKVVDQVFDTRDEAMAHMLTHAVAIVETNTTFGESDIPLPPDRVRRGDPRRNGNVVGDDFKKAFGLRGVEFGNWNNQGERQALMNDAWDGLMDLADVLGLPPKALGMNGELALAFGARGHGLQGARAHYELERVVINLTKEKGAGSLAHEWFHALDHYLGRQDGKASAEWVVGKDGTRTLKVSDAESAFASSGFSRQSKVREELRAAYKKLLETMFQKAEVYVQDTEKADKFVGMSKVDLDNELRRLREELAEQKNPKYWKRNNAPASAEQLAEFDAIAKQMVNAEVAALATELRSVPTSKDKVARRWTNDSLERLNALNKEVRGRSGFNAERKGVLDRLQGMMERYSQRLKMLAEAQNGDQKTRAVPTEFAMDAKELDQGRGGDYWTTPHEMAARAFQGFVEDRIAQRGDVSRFLNYGPENAFIETPWGFKRPFPAGKERQAINAALENFLGQIQTREDDAGNVAMYSRGQAGQGIRPSAVQAAVDRITGKWGNAPEVEVLGSMADAPEAVRNHDAKMRSQGAQGEPEGFFYKGKVYLNASMLGDQAAVERVLFHETLGHFGLRGAFGTELDAVLRQVIGGRRAEVEAKRKAYGLPDTDAGRLVAAEEVLAELAQTKPELGLVQRAMAAIRSLLRKLGLVDGLSDAELVRNFITPARDFVERGGQAQDFTDTEPMVRQVFSRMTQSQAFKRWFGDSKVVDAEGKPLAVYHGTRHDFTEFDTERGELGAHFGTAEQADRVLDFWRAKKYQGLRVMPAYLAIRNPLRLKDSGHFGRLAVGEQLVRMGLLDRVPTASEGIEAVKQAIIDAGFDGVVYENTREGKGDSWIAFRPEQIKSATGNNGQYDPANPDIRFSLDKPLVDEDGLDGTLYSRAPSRQAFADFMEAAKDRTSTSRFNFLHKTLATQLHKAWVDKDYSKVFERAQDFERDIARAAARPAEAAPDLMPAFDNVRSAWHRFTHGNKDAERIKEVGAALWAGTLEGGPEPHTGKVWSAAQLRERFKFDDEQIKLYEQARAAIGASLDESAAALAFEMVKAYAPGLRDAVRREPGKLRELLEGERELLEAMGDDASAALYQALGVLDRADELKAGGYMPLMRFGKYAVSVTNDAGEVLHFEKHETELQAKTAALKLRREYPAAKVERSTMDTEGFKLFAGVDPESVALFAKQLEGHIQDDALQQWYRNAVSERSAMKRMIGPRKGTAGFDQDLRRVLASFITSNARLAARQLNMGDMTAAIQDMRERRVAGDVVDEAVKLKEYLENPDEPFKGLRSLMFTWYLGGSVASAAVNATQPLMMTLPYLSQFGSATKALLGATKEAMTGKVSDEKLAKAMQRAAEDGKVDPQEIHHLYHEGMSGVIDRLPGGDSLKARAQGAATLWGYMFGAVENFNRRLTFIAAYRMAEGKPELGDPYSFAIKAIDETQGIYGKSNRPNWARGTGSFGAVGVAAFTFKQYSIGYVELLVRLAKSGPKGQLAVASMLGLLFLAAGMQGLPFAEDLEDLADTVAQKLGYRGNSRAAMREILHDKMGTQLGDLVMYGASGALPLDIQGRLGMGNLAPATGIFMETNRDRKGQQIAEIFGPMGGFASQVGDAYSAKDASGVLASFAPIAIKNALKGMEMADTGQYKDMRGRNVTETDGTDAFLKGIGFQPTSVASVRRPERLIAQDVTRVRQVEADIVRMRAQAMAESDPDLRREADEALREWNERNPELRIRIKDSQVASMVKEMRRTSRDRLLDTAPKETRRALEDSLG